MEGRITGEREERRRMGNGEKEEGKRERESDTFHLLIHSGDGQKPCPGLPVTRAKGTSSAAFSGPLSRKLD